MEWGSGGVGEWAKISAAEIMGSNLSLRSIAFSCERSAAGSNLIAG